MKEKQRPFTVTPIMPQRNVDAISAALRRGEMDILQITLDAFRNNPKKPLSAFKKSIVIIHQDADYHGSRRILEQNGLRFLTYQEAFRCSSQLISNLKGKTFYLSGKGISRLNGSNMCKTNVRTGELIGLDGTISSGQYLVEIIEGPNPLSLRVNAERYKRAFDINGFMSPDHIVEVILGIPK